MKRIFCAIVSVLLILLSSVSAGQGVSRALLVACSDFLTQPSLGSATSGNLHMVGSAFISSDIAFGDLSIEDGTIGTVEELETAVFDAFSTAEENDLSILYLCTHGILSSADDAGAYLLLGDGMQESALSSQRLFELLGSVSGQKLLILDACYSGAIIGRGMPHAQAETEAFYAPISNDPSIHVLTSASGHESSWYYDSEHLASGAVSYFASALASGLGLYGTPEADLNGDGCITLAELHSHLCMAVPSSSSQLLSARAEQLILPSAGGAALFRPLSGFSFGMSLLPEDDPTLQFSYTVMHENTGVQYRLIDYENGEWDWDNAVLFMDEGDNEDGTLTPGRKTRHLTLSGMEEGESGYLMLQVFSVSDSGLVLCTERLVAVQPASVTAALTIRCCDTLKTPGMQEVPVSVQLDVPAELTVSIFDSEGRLVRRLMNSQLTRPAPGNTTQLYWNGCDASGNPVEDGRYTVTAETRLGRTRLKAAAEVVVGEDFRSTF